MSLRVFHVPLLALLTLAACAREAEEPEKPVDPAISAALAGPLLTEPDLAAMNGAGRALTGTGVASAQIPANLYSAESLDAARDEAKALLGGTTAAAPVASGSGQAEGGQTSLHALRIAFGTLPCEGAATWSAIWAARLPQSLAPYPRGHVEEAFGADEGACHLRAITYRTGATSAEIVDYHAAQAKKAGLSIDHRANGDAHALILGGAQTAKIYVRPGPDGLAEVQIVSKGG